MRIALAELAPRRGEVDANLDAIARVARAAPADLVVFPELFVSGYRVGDAVHRLALDPATLSASPLAACAAAVGRTLVVGAPLRSAERPGEVQNAAVLFPPRGAPAVQVKRFLPTYGPFEEGSVFTPTSRSRPIDVEGASVGLEICYDAFFPEVSRELALSGAVLLVVISAAPVTSRRLFEKVLPARAVENAVPLVYVNRVGVEDGLVFGGGSGAWDARGEPLALEPAGVDGRGDGESVRVAELDLTDAPRWRPFRPVLRDRAGSPGPGRPPLH
jgi:predicted amidohydrolase